jgi:hypothetical protein
MGQKMQHDNEQTGHHFGDITASKINKLSIVKQSKNRFSYHVPSTTTELKLEMNQKFDPIMQFYAEKAGNGVRSPLSS